MLASESEICRLDSYNNGELTHKGDPRNDRQIAGTLCLAESGTLAFKIICMTGIGLFRTGAGAYDPVDQIACHSGDSQPASESSHGRAEAASRSRGQAPNGSPSA